MKRTTRTRRLPTKHQTYPKGDLTPINTSASILMSPLQLHIADGFVSEESYTKELLHADHGATDTGQLEQTIVDLEQCPGQLEQTIV
ncbi:hypothetical protein TNCV_1906721 [Trichonephila clavipes]|nr:hypothetical protein TNCV_1906721 [Trichonephila clavipes]